MKLSTELTTLLDMIESPQASSADFANLRLPESMQALATLREDQEMFVGMDTEDKDPRRSLKPVQVPIPEPRAGEAVVAVMASGINFNTVWSAIFEPLSTHQFLAQYAQSHPRGRLHQQDYHILGSDAAGVVVRVGEGVTRWKPGDRVTVNPSVFGLIDPAGHDDPLVDPDARAWGFETNFGGLAQFCLVQESQLMAKPEHMSWEESASLALVSGTAYRMLVSRNGARMKQGDNVLIWGGSGGMGAVGIQYVLNGGGRPVAVVSGPEKAALVRELGCEMVIDRSRLRGGFIKDNGELNMRQLVAFRGAAERLLSGEEIDIVYEHTGRETFSASVFVARRGGKVVTCGSTTGYQHVYDNRYLWMHVKSIIGSHGANFREAYEANRLACLGKIHPTVSQSYPLEQAAEAVAVVKENRHVGKLGVLCLAQAEGLGIRDPQMRERIGEQRFQLFRRHHARVNGVQAAPLRVAA
ncbi:crotonyl-CoA carboxylase/reductase [Acidovorax sp. 106]|uniref:crotonyl-CoA carboxylase/reductase n=1 Tax=Acidovorax sp. 106 TaxID=2135637 RepID=UPI000EAD1FB7|nr:crotonyl-CoA carboxylase/reductase [Acidovorax sp. 106]RLJ36457.1 crotonyl-CoA carboxylase/reductase [Acidovorax sp. 106]